MIMLRLPVCLGKTGSLQIVSCPCLFELAQRFELV